MNKFVNFSQAQNDSKQQDSALSVFSWPREQGQSRLSCVTAGQISPLPGDFRSLAW